MTGREFRRLRRRLGYSLAALSEYIGLAESTICRYQSGVIPIPPVVERLMLAIEPRRRSTLSRHEKAARNQPCGRWRRMKRRVPQKKGPAREP